MEALYQLDQLWSYMDPILRYYVRVYWPDGLDMDTLAILRGQVLPP